MRKKLYSVTVKNRWAPIRFNKHGKQAKTTKWNQGSLNTVVNTITKSDITEEDYLIQRIKTISKSTLDVKVEILSIENTKFICMSNDIYPDD